MSNKEFKPFVSAEKVMPELTVTSIILGLILAVVFGAANAYLGLRVGMTISASIPAAVISMGIIRVIMKRNSILENNMVQTVGSAGESLAAGAIFTMPALFMWAAESSEIAMPSFWNMAIIALLGGILGVLFMIPLRNALIVKEHGVLPFPEGTACAEVLLAGEEGGQKTKIVFSGLGIAALYKFITDGIKLFPSEIGWRLKGLRTGFGLDVLPALTGVGYICGLKISSYIFAGGMLGWFVLIPAISLFGLDENIKFSFNSPSYITLPFKTFILLILGIISTSYILLFEISGTDILSRILHIFLVICLFVIVFTSFCLNFNSAIGQYTS